MTTEIRQNGTLSITLTSPKNEVETAALCLLCKAAENGNIKVTTGFDNESCTLVISVVEH